MSDTIELRGGYTTTDPRLDRLPQFDERSRGYRAVELVPSQLANTPISRTWGLRWLLDQLKEGACTNFALAHDRLCAPRPRRLGGDLVEVEDLARRLYHRSKQLDEWPGENYDGTSLLAAAKAWREAGLLGEFRWTFGIDELILTLGHVGPLVLATDWLQGMFDVGPDGLLDVTGAVAGGHCYLAAGVILHPESHSSWRATGVKGEPLIVGPNSWGPHRSPHEPATGEPWGRNGWWAMRASDLERLLLANGESLLALDKRHS